MKYKINPNITVRIIDNELVILNIDKGDYYSLNDTGKTIFENLQKNNTIDEIINNLSDTYPEIEKNVLISDVNELLKDLIDENIIII